MRFKVTVNYNREKIFFQVWFPIFKHPAQSMFALRSAPLCFYQDFSRLGEPPFSLLKRRQIDVF